MKKIFLSESEKKSLLNLHINNGYNTFISEQEEIINTTHDKAWDYKKVGEEYFTKRKGTEKWIKPTGAALEAIKTKVKFESPKSTETKPTDTNSTETKPEETNTTDTNSTNTNSNDTNSTETNTTDTTSPESQNNTSNKERIKCDVIINAIAYNARGNKGDTSLVTPQKWYEYFGIKLEDTNSSEIKSALSQLKNDTENGVKKSYTFKNLTLPINLTNKYLKLQEDSCCINIKEGIIGNYDFNITNDKNDDEKSVADGNIRILIRYNNIEKVNCNE